MRVPLALIVLIVAACAIASQSPRDARLDPTDVTLRFMDAETGKPIGGLSLDVSAWDENEGRQKRQAPGTIRIDKNTQLIKTDRAGRAVFHLYQEPMLKSLYIATFDLRGCSARQFLIEEVLHSGVVANYKASQGKWCPALKVQTEPQPAEIVIFDKRLTRLDRIRQEIP